MPQGGKCSYAELVSNTQRLYRALQQTSEDSEDLVLFTHGGARRGYGFTDSRDNNIRALLANRLGKSPTTINKYLQHGAGLNDAAMEELVSASAPKLFFEAIQARKQTEIAIQQSEQKDPAAIAEATSKKVMQWLAEYQKPEQPPATGQESDQSPETGQEPEQSPETGQEPEQSPETGQEPEQSPPRERSGPSGRPASNGNRGPASTPRSPQNGSGDNPDPPANDPTPTDGTAPTVELKQIGEALIEIADNQESSTQQKIETIRALILDLSRLLQRFAQPAIQEGGEAGGTA